MPSANCLRTEPYTEPYTELCIRYHNISTNYKYLYFLSKGETTTTGNRPPAGSARRAVARIPREVYYPYFLFNPYLKSTGKETIQNSTLWKLYKERSDAYTALDMLDEAVEDLEMSEKLKRSN